MPIKTVEENRRASAISLFAESKLDALLVTNLHNVRYLTGFTGSNGAVLLFHAGPAILFTDPRYTVQSQQQVNCRVRIAKGPLTKSILQEVDRSRVVRLGFEQDNLTVLQLESLKRDLPVRTQLEPVTGFVERLRMVKDAGEITRIRASVLANSRALEAALKRFRIGMRESDLAAEIDYGNRKLSEPMGRHSGQRNRRGGGERSALPHAHAGSTKIGPGSSADRYGARSAMATRAI